MWKYKDWAFCNTSITSKMGIFLFLSSSFVFQGTFKGDIEQDGCLSVLCKLICLHYRMYSNGPIMY